MTAEAPKKARKPGTRKQTVRAKVEATLAAAGWRPAQYRWIDGPNRLLIVFGVQLKEIHVPGGISSAKLERVLGRIEGWTDAMQRAA